MKFLMLAFSSRQQYHVMRAAAAAGHTVHVLGRDCAESLRHSRYCSGFHPLRSDLASQPLDAALEEIKQCIRAISAGAILPADIVSTRLLIALAGRLPVPTCALPDAKCFDMMNDKWQFYQFCRARGIRVPDTWLMEDTAQLKSAIRAGSITYPFIVKPHDGMGNWGIYRVMDESGLQAVEQAQYRPLLVQKFITGNGVDISILADKGRIGAYAVQYNLPSEYVFIKHDRLLAEADRTVKASGFHGVAHFDAIEEEGTGDVYMIECNPRFWFSIFAALVAGLNFVQLSLKPEALNPDRPQCLSGMIIPSGRITHHIAKKLMSGRMINAMEFRMLMYSLSDPSGKRTSMEPRFDDALLAPSSPGSIAYQGKVLAALRAQS